MKEFVFPATLGFLTAGLLFTYGLLPILEIKERKAGQDFAFAETTQTYQQEAIKNHYARFDSETGKWRWNTADETWGKLSVESLPLPNPSPEVTTEATNLFPSEPLPVKKSTPKSKK